MSLNNYLSKDRKLNNDRVQHCLNVGLQGEDLFKSLTKAVKTSVQLDKKHIDFLWDGKRVDVKGLKPTHKYGIILLEFMNVWGNHGWCSKKSKADYIAFQFTDAFYVFRKDELRLRAIQLCVPYSNESVIRKNRIRPQDGIGKWLGRYNAKDIFTYIRFQDIQDLVCDRIEIPNNNN